ncbi:two-component sensor histidine kinase, partial [Micromonospora zamorensis]
MSSNPPSRRRPLRAARRWLAGRSLRTRLVFALLALLAVVSVAIGGLTTVALRHFLIERLDAQLAPATVMRGDRPGRPAFPGTG